MAVPLMVAAAGMQIATSLIAANSAKKAAKAQAAALKKRAQEIIARGEINANATIQQGELDQTTYATDQASSGFRYSMSDFDSLNVLKTRASEQADNIRREAQWEANASISEMEQFKQKSKSEQTQGYLGAATTAMGAYSSYKGYK